MVSVLYDKNKAVQVDLTKIPISKQGRIRLGGLPSEAKRFVHALSPGRLCAVKEMHVIGHSRASRTSFFKVGDNGLLPYKTEKGYSMGIDVKREVNPITHAREAVVINTGSSAGIKSFGDIVSLERRGVSTIVGWNEGTFSPSGGWNTYTDVGEYIESIAIGEKAIMGINPKVIGELELRLRSVPFVLPWEYLISNSRQETFGSMNLAASNAMLEMITEKGYIGKPLTRDEEDALRERAEEYCHIGRRETTPAQKRFWTKTMRQINASRANWTNRKNLLTEGEERVRRAVMENITLNAIGGVIADGIGHSSGYKTARGYEIWEVNEGCEPNDKTGKLERRPKRGFELVPSDLFLGLVYAIPKSDYSGQHLIKSLLEFNSRYPDTTHTVEARENYFPGSILN